MDVGRLVAVNYILKGERGSVFARDREQIPENLRAFFLVPTITYRARQGNFKHG